MNVLVIQALARVPEDGSVTPGVLGFVVVALLGLATFFLIKSMNRQIRRIDVPPGNAPSPPGRDPLPPQRESPDDDQPRTD